MSKKASEETMLKETILVAVTCIFIGYQSGTDFKTALFRPLL